MLGITMRPSAGITAAKRVYEEQFADFRKRLFFAQFDYR
jgi:hypothetical protein